MGILTMAIIAKCAFGMTIDNLGGENDSFIQNAKRMINPSGHRSLAFLLIC